MKSYTYLLINIGCIAIPFIFSFYSKHAFFKDWKHFFKANILVAILFLIWDYFFIEAGIWGFNPDYLTGIYFANLPIEEILFFISIPYACVFTYFALNYLVKTNPFSKIQNIITYLFILILLFIAISNSGKLYTSFTFIVTGLFLILLAIKKVDLSYYYLSYLIILPFFLISNGLLTGSFLSEPIVWYNDAENLGLRIGTIPIEDSIYGLLLIFSNISLYEYFKD